MIASIILRAFLIFLLLAVRADYSSSAAQSGPAGYWTGHASFQGADLPLELRFESTPSGLTGFFSAPTLRAHQYPLRNTVFDGSRLTFDLVGDAGAFPFRGTLVGSDSLIGNWNLFGANASVALRRTDTPSLPYAVESVTCRNGNVFLQGTLFLPRGSGAYPAAVFVHGSGGETRDANNFVADQLARAGVAALAFDKRGAGASTGDWREADFDDLAKDVLACVQALKARKDIMGSKIGLVGASQAGWIAPLAASLSSDVAFMALTSGPTVPVWREGWWDTEFRLRERGFGRTEIEQAGVILRMNDEVTRSGRGFEELQGRLDRARQEPWFASLGFQQAPPADAPFRRFYRRMIDFDPQPMLQRISVPSLWLFGDRDAEMPAEESAAILERLRAQGKDVTVKIFPGADHALFIAPTAGQPFRWPRLFPGYVETLTDWVKIAVR